MDKDQQQQFSRVSRYLKNVYNGIDTPEYSLAFDNHQKITEKIKNVQEIEDIHHFAPKYKEYSEREKEEREKFE
jgi:hypothetical protein